MTAAERGDVGRLGAVQQVPAREQPRPRRPQARVDRRPAGSRIELGAREHRELVVGDPIGREHDRVAVDPSPRPVASSVSSTASTRARRGSPSPRSRSARGRESAPTTGPEEGERLMARQLGRHRDGPGASMVERQQGRESVLGADHDGPRPDPLSCQIDELLEHSGRHHPLRACARHQPRRPRPLPAAGRQHDRLGADRAPPSRPGQLQRAVRPPAGRLRSEAQLGARCRRDLGPARRVPGPGRTMQVAQPEAAVLSMAGNASRRSLAVDDDDRGRLRTPQLGGAARPEGPLRRSRPPPTRCSRRSLPELARLSSCPGGHLTRHLRTAEETLAAAHQHPGPPAQPVQVERRNGAGGGVADLAARDPLAEADDLPVRGRRRSARRRDSARERLAEFGIRICGRPVARSRRARPA